MFLSSTSLGFDCPVSYNPADFFINVLSHNKISSQIIKNPKNGTFKHITSHRSFALNGDTQKYVQMKIFRNQFDSDWCMCVFFSQPQFTLDQTSMDSYATVFFAVKAGLEKYFLQTLLFSGEQNRNSLQYFLCIIFITMYSFCCRFHSLRWVFFIRMLPAKRKSRFKMFREFSSF